VYSAGIAPPSAPTVLDNVKPAASPDEGVTLTDPDEIPVPAEFVAVTEHE
jgi:hypothetical protein